MTYNLIHVIQHNESTFFQAGVSLCVMFSSDIYTVIRLDCQAFCMQYFMSYAFISRLLRLVYILCGAYS